VRGGHPGGRGDGDADDVGAGRDLAGDADVEGVSVAGVGLARLGLERPGERGAEADADLFVPRQRDEDDPAAMALGEVFLGDRVQSL
jgi:hypothetical protein